MRRFLVVCGLFAAHSAEAAVIEKISADGSTVVLSLSKQERVGVKEGEPIAVRTGAKGQLLVGRVLDLDGGRAVIQVKRGADGLTAGRRVRLASADGVGAMQTTPRPADVAAAPARGEAAVAELPLAHVSMVSPAQVYQMRSSRSDGELSYQTTDYTLKSGFDKIKAELAGAGVRVAAIHAPQAMNVRLGLEASHLEMGGRVKGALGGTSETESMRMMQTGFGPVLGARVDDRWFAGARYTVTEVRYTGRAYGASHDISYGRPQFGVVYHAPALEAGVAYAAKVDAEDKVDGETLREQLPPTVTAHARHRLTDQAAVFGSVSLHQNNVFNVDDEHRWKNNASLALGGEHKAGRGVVDGAALFHSEAAAGYQHRSYDTLMRYGAVGGYRVRYGQTAEIGGSLEYQTAGDKYRADNGTRVSLERNDWRLGVVGKMRL